jgi:hypothetical protein
MVIAKTAINAVIACAANDRVIAVIVYARAREGVIKTQLNARHVNYSFSRASANGQIQEASSRRKRMPGFFRSQSGAYGNEFPQQAFKHANATRRPLTHF